ncbi:MAG TPA: DUF58 domain-containing protein [Clostridiales bacterium]|nr:DUF58 domain-containing protein [Clostridiales bacterium]
MTGVKEPKPRRKGKRETELRYDTVPKKRMRFGIGGGFYVWLFTLFFGLVFTQALHSSMSGLFFVSAMLMPIGALIYILIGLPQLTASASSDDGEVEKYAKTAFTVFVENPLPLPYPFVDVDITVPSDHAVRCESRRLTLSLAPFSLYEMKTPVVFAYRGRYEISVKSLYVWDMLRIFRIRADIDSEASVFVVPRRITLESAADTGSADVDSDSSKSVIGAERSEMNDVRSYRQGDHMKQIHWKLSSKQQELVTKEYTMNSGKTAYLLVDMYPRWDSSDPEQCDDDVNEYAADTVVECTIAVALRELNNRNSCTMIWYDDRSQSDVAVYSMETPLDFEKVYPVIATAPLSTTAHKISDLAALTDGARAIALLFVTPRLDVQIVSELIDACASSGISSVTGTLKVYYCPPEPKVRNFDRDLERRCLEQLAASGIIVEKVTGDSLAAGIVSSEIDIKEDDIGEDEINAAG